MLKTLLTSAAVAVVGLTAIEAGWASPSQASGRCTPVYAVRTMNDALAGGASLSTAWEWTIADGHATDTKRCWTMVSGYGRGLRYAFPYFYNRVWN